MIASEQSDSVGPPGLECHEKAEGLKAEVAPIDKVAHEDVARLWWLSTYPKELEEIPELAMDVAAHRDRTGYGLDVGLFKEQGFDNVA